MQVGRVPVAVQRVERINKEGNGCKLFQEKVTDQQKQAETPDRKPQQSRKPGRALRCVYNVAHRHDPDIPNPHYGNEP
ncbi:hypothetical protein SAMN06265219_111142 [Gracilimonas mengyeensis]|uniref:Uncharacterized protein n=1 Tax=Gracilimonas mengyeensis TaxID=1302730 RepID=A0A521EE99_9BACT|nr:hypothetical protein SAMN06265219_111142 [Gracilimonas mengyeensis]